MSEEENSEQHRKVLNDAVSVGFTKTHAPVGFLSAKEERTANANQLTWFLDLHSKETYSSFDITVQKLFLCLTIPCI